MEQEQSSAHNHNKEENRLIEKNDNLVAHALSSAAFATVGAKLSYLGTFHDIDAILGKQKVSFWQKVKWSVDGTLFEKTKEKISHLTENGANNRLTAFLKATKYSSGLMAIGAGVGAVVGWVRGGLIADWHNIYRHPLDSTKVVLGLANPDILEKYDTKKPEQVKLANLESSNKMADSSKWQDYIKSRATTEQAKQI